MGLLDKIKLLNEGKISEKNLRDYARTIDDDAKYNDKVDKQMFDYTNLSKPKKIIDLKAYTKSKLLNAYKTYVDDNIDENKKKNYSIKATLTKEKIIEEIIGKKIKMKEFIKLLDNDINVKNNKSTKKLTNEEIFYNELINNPKYSEVSKNQLKRNTNNGKNLNMEDLNAWKFAEDFVVDSSSDEEEEIKPKPKPKKTYKEMNLMKGRSDIRNKNGKTSVETELNIRKGLDNKVKRALRNSIETELDKKIKSLGF